jgi:hypothetical protein
VKIPRATCARPCSLLQRRYLRFIGVEKDFPESVLALDQADSMSLCENAAQDSWRVHSLVSRVVRFELSNNDRIEQLRKGL